MNLNPGQSKAKQNGRKNSRAFFLLFILFVSRLATFSILYTVGMIRVRHLLIYLSPFKTLTAVKQPRLTGHPAYLTKAAGRLRVDHLLFIALFNIRDLKYVPTGVICNCYQTSFMHNICFVNCMYPKFSILHHEGC